MSNKIFNVIVRKKKNDEFFYCSDGYLFLTNNEIEGFFCDEYVYGGIVDEHLILAIVYSDYNDDSRYLQLYKGDEPCSFDECDVDNLLSKVNNSSVIDAFNSVDSNDHNYQEDYGDEEEYDDYDYDEDNNDDDDDIKMIIKFLKEEKDLKTIIKALEQLDIVKKNIQST